MRASVIVDVPARSIGRAFDYRVPDELAGQARVGCAVCVEFGARPVVGYIVGLSDGEAAGDAAGEGGAVSAGEAGGVDAGEAGEANAVSVSADASASGEGSVGAAATSELGAAKKPRALKDLLGVVGGPYFDETAAHLAAWIASEYLCPLSDAVHLFTPPGAAPKMKRADGAWQLVYPGTGAVDDRWVVPLPAATDFTPPARAHRQKAVLDALSEGGMRVAELSAELGAVDAALKALEKHGVVRVEHRRRMRTGFQKDVAPDAPLPHLTPGQQAALDAIGQAATHPGGGQTVVVDGVTGSGKTEVYLRAIADCLERGRGAIVLVPEISLTPQTVGRFRARFGDDVAVLHSRLSLGERFDQLDLVRQGAAHVVVGTRSALFAPLFELGLVIIDEEHESSYKQDRSPRYHAREVAERLVALRHATLVLGSATPDLVTHSRCGDAGQCAMQAGAGRVAQSDDARKHTGGEGENEGRAPGGGTEKSRAQRSGAEKPRAPWRRVELPERANGRPMPHVEVVDLGAQFKGGERSMFSPALAEALACVCERGEKAVLLFNRRGFANFLLCRECGYTPECPHCAVSLSYHERSAALVCHHCGHEEAVPPRCPVCGSPYLRKLGAGTEKVEQELSALLSGAADIVRMDADTTRGKGAHERLLERFGATAPAVLLGTQMIAKGLDYPDVTLVGVLNADTSLKLPDYRAGERTWQLIEQVAGRCGRGKRSGRVIVQTYQPAHPAIRAAAAHDRALFLDGELQARWELGYPPFTRLANVLVWGPDEDEVSHTASRLFLSLSSAVQSAGADWELLGPAPCLLSRLKGRYRWHILVKAAPDADFPQVMGDVLAQKRARGEVRVAVDVDPTSLF